MAAATCSNAALPARSPRPRTQTLAWFAPPQQGGQGIGGGQPEVIVAVEFQVQAGACAQAPERSSVVNGSSTPSVSAKRKR